ncbi:MAG: FmdB family zinc ribbon protein [Almyronema sp.]
MPLYEFSCADCGIFDEWRSLATRSDPAYCPSCQTLGKRVFSAPALLSGSVRLKRESPEPQRVQRDLEPQQPRVKSHTGGRPWMIGH